MNQRAVNGVLYNADPTLHQQAFDLFAALNSAGGIEPGAKETAPF